MPYKDRKGEPIQFGDYVFLYGSWLYHIGRVFILPTSVPGTGAHPQAFGLITDKRKKYDRFTWLGYPYVDSLVISKTFKMQHYLCWSFDNDLTVLKDPDPDITLELPYLSNNLK